MKTKLKTSLTPKGISYFLMLALMVFCTSCSTSSTDSSKSDSNNAVESKIKDNIESKYLTAQRGYTIQSITFSEGKIPLEFSDAFSLYRKWVFSEGVEWKTARSDRYKKYAVESLLNDQEKILEKIQELEKSRSEKEFIFAMILAKKDDGEKITTSKLIYVNDKAGNVLNDKTVIVSQVCNTATIVTAALHNKLVAWATDSISYDEVAKLTDNPVVKFAIEQIPE